MEGFIDKGYLTEHLNGKMRLLDGRLIDGFPKLDRQTNVKGGSYDLFISNANWLFQNRCAILKDSRMFLVPLNIDNNLAYTGSYGFEKPVLGVYIEWWQNCKESLIRKSDGSNSLVCFMDDSPLSGINFCMMVDKNGMKEKVTIRPFRNLWKTFVSINTRYKSCKDLYDAYTLEDVISILKSRGESGNHC